MPETSLTPFIEEFKTFLSKTVKKSDHFTSETMEAFTRELLLFFRTLERSLCVAFLQLNQTTDNSVVREGAEYLFKKTENKEYATLFGKIVVPRRVYYNSRLKRSVVPLDESWEMTDQYATVEVRETIGFLTGFLTPTAIYRVLSRFTGISLSVSTIGKLGDRIGESMERAKQGIIAESHKKEIELPNGTEVVAVSLDGVNMLLREPGTLKRRAPERPGHENATDGVSCYKNAGVATISCYSKEIRENESVLQRRSTLVLAHTPEERMKSLKSEFEAEVSHCLRIAPPNVKKVVVMDGARGLWKYVDECVLFNDWTQIIDFHHCCEHLSKLAEKLFGKKSAEGKKWYSRCRKALLTKIKGINKLINSAKYYIRKMKKSSLLKELTYFTHNKARMRYAAFKQVGLPIGSGPVEAACKTIVKARLCCSGMRWTRERAQRVLRIRTIIRNDRWDTAWSICKFATAKSATN
jgi:hypothetical protein